MLSWNLYSRSYYIFLLPHKSLSKPEHHLQGLSIPWCSVYQAAVLKLKPRKTLKTPVPWHTRQRISINSPFLPSIILTLLSPSLCVKMASDLQQGTGGSLRPRPVQRKKQARKMDRTQLPSPSVLVSACPFHTLTKHSSSQSPVLPEEGWVLTLCPHKLKQAFRRTNCSLGRKALKSINKHRRPQRCWRGPAHPAARSIWGIYTWLSKVIKLVLWATSPTPSLLLKATFLTHFQQSPQHCRFSGCSLGTRSWWEAEQEEAEGGYSWKVTHNKDLPPPRRGYVNGGYWEITKEVRHVCSRSSERPTSSLG